MTECLKLKYDEVSSVETVPGTGRVCTPRRLFAPKAYVRNVRELCCFKYI